jgi:hypothetical protein
VWRQAHLHPVQNFVEAHGIATLPDCILQAPGNVLQVNEHSACVPHVGGGLASGISHASNNVQHRYQYKASNA